MYGERPIERYASRMLELFKRHWEDAGPKDRRYRVDLKLEIEKAARMVFIRSKRQTPALTPREEVRLTMAIAIKKAVAKDPENRRIVKVTDLKPESIIKPKTEEAQPPKGDDASNPKATQQATQGTEKPNATKDQSFDLNSLFYVLLVDEETLPAAPKPEAQDDDKPRPDIPVRAAPAHSRQRRHDQQMQLPF